MTKQQEKILEAIKHCEEVIQDNSNCIECKMEHQNLKECLELVFEVLPILDKYSLEELKEVMGGKL